MSSVAGNDGQSVSIGGQPYVLQYSMASLEKIEKQFGSLGEMQAALTDDRGEIRLDRPVVTVLIDIIHAGLLDDFPDTPEGRDAVARGFAPSDMEKMVDAMTLAFGGAFGDMLGKATPPVSLPNRAARRASPGTNGTTRPRSPSGARKKTGKG
jgi:hypothetical protein